jgi:hypothetical protein
MGVRPSSLVLPVVMGIFVVAMAIMSLTLSPVARLVPLIVSVATAGLLVADVANRARSRAPATTDPPDVTAGVSGDGADLRTELGVIAWLAGLLAAGYLLGLAAGLPLYLFLYLRVRSGESWTASAVSAALFWCVLHGVLVSLLRVPLYTGLLPL